MDYWARGLTEFKAKPDRLSDLLQWVCLIEDGIILNKNGSMQKTYFYRGPDLQSYSDKDMRVLADQMNGILKRIDGGWVFYAEARRQLSHKYPKSGVQQWPDPVSYLIDQERQILFNSEDYYESYYYVTFCYLSAEDKMSFIEKVFVEKGIAKYQKQFDEILKYFKNKLYEITDVLKGRLPEFRPLTDDETMSYLYNTVNAEFKEIKTPKHPVYLDCLLTASPLVGGFEPKLGNKHLRVITIKNYPEDGSPNMLNELNESGFEYRWVTRFIFMDSVEAEKEINKYSKLWAAGRKTLLDAVKNYLGLETKENVEAAKKEYDADDAKACQQASETAYGFCVQTIILMDEDIKRLEIKMRETERIINSLGMVSYRESINNLEAWLGSIPCLANANIRRPILSTHNLACIMPLSNSWCGPVKNKHLDGPPLFFAMTGGRTPFRFVNHADGGDVGHSMVIGPTGTGKSVVLGFWAVQFLRYPRAKVYFFDKGGSVKALTAGVGGRYYEINSEKKNSLKFQPLAKIEDIQERRWVSEWIISILKREGVPITPQVSKDVWEALNLMVGSPTNQKTMTEFKAHLSSRDLNLGAAIEKYTQTGTYGNIMDASESFDDNLSWMAFEMELVMNFKNLVPSVLAYMFHILEQKFTGDPTLLILDEAWVFLDDPYFSEKIKDWLQTLRKYNVSVVFATPGAIDILNSEIASTIIGQCPTQIFLPNMHAFKEDQYALYKKLSLSDVQIKLIREAVPKRQYYIVQGSGNRLIDLQMSKIGLHYCGTTSKEDQKKVDEIIAKGGNFNEQFVRWKNIDLKDEYMELIKGGCCHEEV